MRIGGPAQITTIEHLDDLPAILQAAHLFGTPARWLGKGANLLVTDEEIAEPILCLGVSSKVFEHEAITRSTSGTSGAGDQNDQKRNSTSHPGRSS